MLMLFLRQSEDEAVSMARKEARAASGIEATVGGEQGVEAQVAATQAGGTPAADVVVTIKKYANRRLYNTATSCYVTLDHLSAMVKDGTDFVVYDAKTGEDITRAVLTQIIVEEESKGQNLLPISFLRQLISLYGDSMQWMVPKYLEQSMRSFAHNHEQMRRMMQDTIGGIFPFGNLEEMGKQHMAMFERAMKMFTPFPNATSEASTETEIGQDVRLAALQQQIRDLQEQIQAFSRINRPEKG